MNLTTAPLIANVDGICDVFMLICLNYFLLPGGPFLAHEAIHDLMFENFSIHNQNTTN